MSASSQTGDQGNDSSHNGQPRKDIGVIDLDGLTPPDSRDCDTWLNDLYGRVEKWAKDAIDWYLERKNSRKSQSLFFRYFAAVCTIIGGLIPLLISILTNLLGMDPIVIGQVGYVFLAVAAACLTIDRLFDLSTGWMRSMKTSIALQAVLTQFQMDWQIFLYKKSKQGASPDSDLYEEMLERLKSFCLEFTGEIGGETENWQKKLMKNLKLEEEEAKAKAQKARPSGKQDGKIPETTGVESPKP